MERLQQPPGAGGGGGGGGESSGGDRQRRREQCTCRGMLMASSSLERAGYLAELMGVSMAQGRCFSGPALALTSSSLLNMKLDHVDHHCSPLLSSPSNRLITHGLVWREG